MPGFLKFHMVRADTNQRVKIYGNATISKDKAVIKELWEPLLKTWFTEREDDPRITVIKVSGDDGYYWGNKHGNALSY